MIKRSFILLLTGITNQNTITGRSVPLRPKHLKRPASVSKSILLILVLTAILYAPTLLAQTKDPQEKAKQEILTAEAAFCKMAKEQGLETAFLAFAADDAVICRTTKIYKGKAGIKQYYDHRDKADQLTWKPTFVSVSAAGDMGYTYGEYDFSGIRVGNTLTDHGIFHTVWKKQQDGTWKFVYD